MLRRWRLSYRGLRRRWRFVIWFVAWLMVLIGLAFVPDNGSNLTGFLLFVFFLGTAAGLLTLVLRSQLHRRHPPARPIRGLVDAERSLQPFRPGQRLWRRPGGVRWLWSGGIVAFDTAATATDLTARIQYAVKPERAFDYLIARGRLSGWVDGGRLQVTTNIPFLFNSFNSVLDAQLQPAPSGTRLVGVLRLRRAMFAFMVGWLAFAAAIGVFVTVTTLVEPA
ncbi:MAG: hypothetical protein JOZ75_09275, partial [Candidatus Dormibacteraeota bacterium]|nr:hypothetical protein [Candidatus Dormibacteraeota bacterium]